MLFPCIVNKRRVVDVNVNVNVSGHIHKAILSAIDAVSYDQAAEIKRPKPTWTLIDNTRWLVSGIGWRV